MEKVSSKAEFREMVQRQREQRAELVPLPSGLVARLVRPTPGEMFMRTGRLPQSVAARIAGVVPGTMTGEELVAVAHQTVDLCRFVFYEPRIPDDLEPGVDISYEDLEYALRWARGEVAPDGDAGRDLAEFRRDKPR